ncbi:MAG: hypothetical protein ABFD60_01770 [Bryobacteraceae bacterium]
MLDSKAVECHVGARVKTPLGEGVILNCFRVITVRLDDGRVVRVRYRDAKPA